MKRIKVAVATLVPVVFLALALTAAGAPAKVAKSAGGSTSCHPGNEFTVDTDFGAFFATSTGSASDGTGSVSWTFSQKVTGNKDHGGGAYAYNAGGMSGSLSATFHLNAVAHEVNFTSHCIQEANLFVARDGTPTALAEFEGVVDNAPWQPGDHAAVLTIDLDALGCMVAGPSPQVACAAGPAGRSLDRATITLEHGVTCAEDDHGQYDYTIHDESPSGSMSDGFKGKGRSGERGRASLPGGVTPGPAPCEGVTLDPEPQ
jgi:hypothetical protein